VKGTEARATFVLKAPEPAVPAKKPVPAQKSAPAKKQVLKKAAR
jgi:hypothetical protein